MSLKKQKKIIYSIEEQKYREVQYLIKNIYLVIYM